MPVGLAQILSPCVSPSRIIHSSDIHKSLRTSESGSSVSRDSVSITSPTIIHQPSPTPIQIKDNLSSSKYTCSHITSTMTQVLNETFPITCQTLFNVYYSNKATHQFWKRFLEKRNCKNITVTDWVTPIAESSILLNNDTPIKEMTRNCGYIQPVNSTLVKESVCEIVEVCVEAHNNGFCIESKTYTRNVPAGNTFYTKVHVCCSQSMMDSTVSLGSTKSSVHLTVKCEVVFEKFSFLKSMIVAGCIDGMRKVYSELNDELRLEILEKNLDTLLVKMERVNECSMVVGCATKESEQKRDDDIEVHETTTNEKVQDTRSDVLDNIVALALQDPRIQRLIEVLTTILCVLVAILAINVYVLVFK